MSYDVWHQFLVKIWFFQIIEYSCEWKRKQKQPATTLRCKGEGVKKVWTKEFATRLISGSNHVVVVSGSNYMVFNMMIIEDLYDR